MNCAVFGSYNYLSFSIGAQCRICFIFMNGGSSPMTIWVLITALNAILVSEMMAKTHRSRRDMPRTSRYFVGTCCARPSISSPQYTMHASRQKDVHSTSLRFGPVGTCRARPASVRQNTPCGHPRKKTCAARPYRLSHRDVPRTSPASVHQNTTMRASHAKGRAQHVPTATGYYIAIINIAYVADPYP